MLIGVQGLHSPWVMDDLNILSCVSFQTTLFKYEDFCWLRDQWLPRFQLEKISFEIEEISESFRRYLKGNTEWYKRASLEAKKIRSYNANLVYPGHCDYPKLFLQLACPPLALVYLGHPIWNQLSGLAVVGSRSPSDLSLAWMEEHLARFLARNEVFLLSGAARGIDQRAHAIALRVGRPTVAIIPSGFEKIYPPEFKQWVYEIIRGNGAVLSEYSIDQLMYKNLFCQRNRLIAGMTEKVFIVEAARKSGTIMTANYALEQDRDVAVLPSHPGVGRCLGGIDLLSQGAKLIVEEADLTVWMRS